MKVKSTKINANQLEIIRCGTNGRPLILNDKLSNSPGYHPTGSRNPETSKNNTAMRLETEELLNLFSSVLSGVLANPKTTIPPKPDPTSKRAYHEIIAQAWDITQEARKHFEAETSQ